MLILKIKLFNSELTFQNVIDRKQNIPFVVQLPFIENSIEKVLMKNQAFQRSTGL
jgi:hypothetical protein